MTAPTPTVARCIQVVSDQTGITIPFLISPRRERHITRPRQIAMWLAYQECPQESLPSIGRAFKRDHTTVLHGVRLIERMRQVQPALAQMCFALQERVRADPRQGRLGF